MNAREQFLRIMSGDTSIPTLKWEFGYWVGTIRRWATEGLEIKRNVITDENDYDETCTGGGIPSPELSHPVDYDVEDIMGLDKGLVRTPVEHWYYPHFKTEVLEETDRSMIVIDDEGITKEIFKGGGSMPKFMRFPMATREDFERIKNERLNPDTPGRFPDNWKEIAKELNERDYPLALGGKPFGFFGSLRELMGFEGCMVMFYDDPELVEEILDHLCGFWLKLYEKVLADITVDYVLFWEDMSYKNGPMISPKLFQKLMVPRYQRMTEFFRSKGVDVMFVDTDGDCYSLIEPLIEGGITGILPFEGAAGMDVEVVRQRHPELAMMGGIDKSLIFGDDKEALDKVLREKVPSVLKSGRYIPFTDHLVPPEVSWEQFVRYRNILNEVIEKSVW